MPCGCREDVDFEDAIRYVDGAPCPRKAERHLWVRRPELVVPTERCRLVEAQDLLALYGADRRPLTSGLATGDFEIEEWRFDEAGWLLARVGARKGVLFPV